MKARNYYTGGSLLSRLSFMLFFAVAGICNVMAESKVYVSDFIINPGEEKVIAVNFDNGDEITSLQMDLTLPEGLSLTGYKANEDRIERDVHTLYVDKQAGNNKYRITVFSQTAEAIPGNGELVSLTLKAADTFTSQGKIVFDEIHLSDSNVPVNRIDLKAFNVMASPEVGHIATNETAFSIKQDGTHTIDVILNNTIDVYGLSGRITLPAGMTFGKNAKGRLDITYGSRLPGDAVVNINEKTGKFVVSAMSNESFGREGVLFSFKVVASQGLAQTSEMVINEVEVSDKKNVVYSFDDVVTINVTNSYLADYIPAMEAANGVQTELNNAIAKIAETCPDVKDSEAIAAAKAGIQSQIDALKAEIEKSYNDETLGANKETVLAPVAEIKTAIEKLLSDAAAAQKAYEADQAKIAANEAAYARLREEIAALQAKLDAAKSSIDNDCKDVADMFVETEQGIQNMIDAATDNVKKQYDAVELTEKSSINSTDIEAAIEKLLSDAAAAQKAYEAEQAKIAANEAAYARLREEIAALQAKLDAAKSSIDNDCKDVADDFTETEQGIQDMIDAIVEEILKQYDSVELTDESSINSAEIEAAIEKLLSDAAAAQKAYEETTGIGYIYNIADKDIKIYSISGKQVDRVMKGQVNIIKYSDGSVKRIFVK